jgi:hypothetical protein
MHGAEDRLRINDEECAARVIDGEAVIINLLNGTYYSLDKVGAVIWESLAEGRTVAETVDAVTARYKVEAARARGDVERLAPQLRDERLLVPADGDRSGAADGAPDAEARGEAPTERLPYEEPALTTYRDMADLLALDPPMPRLEDIVWSDSAERAAGAATD